MSQRLTQQMAIFQPVAHHLLPALSLSSSRHYSARLTPRSCPSSYVTPSLQPAAGGLLAPANSVDISFTPLMLTVSFSVCASGGLKVLT